MVKQNSNIYRDYVPPSGASMFFKFEDAKSKRVRIAGEPYVFTSEFRRGDDVQVSTKYAWVIYNKEDKQAQILQLPVTGFRQVAALGANDEWGDPAGYDLVIMREGTGRETKYTITPSPNKASLTVDEQEAVDKIDLPAAIKNAIPLSEHQYGGADLPPAPDRDQDDNFPFEGAERLTDEDVPPEFR
jgi:hypothetical protein